MFQNSQNKKYKFIIRCSTPGCNNKATWWIDDDEHLCTKCYYEKHNPGTIQVGKQIMPGPTEIK